MCEKHASIELSLNGSFFLISKILVDIELDNLFSNAFLLIILIAAGL